MSWVACFSAFAMSRRLRAAADDEDYVWTCFRMQADFGKRVTYA